MDVVSDMIASAGEGAVAFIIGIAQLLTKSSSSPGIVAIIFALLLLIASAVLVTKTNRQRRAVGEVRRAVLQHNSIVSFAANFEEFRAEIAPLAERAGPRRDLWEAWDEFSETIVPDDVDGQLRLRNSIRPAAFLNVEDLGFGPGLLRILPNTFVSLGLLLTFLGLVAALFDFSRAMGEGGAASGVGLENAMTTFMQIASAKFVMSLVGLLCSILFSVLLRWRTTGVDRDLHKLCLMIERRLVFVSLEDIGFRQLRAATEQREHLREIGFSMVAELRKPLDALPGQITASISEQMEPILQRVTSMGTSNMEGLVGDLSSQLTQSVGLALNQASTSLSDASDRMGQIIDRMSSVNSEAGAGLQTALAQLGEALSELRKDVAATGTAASSAMSEGADRLLGVMNETLEGIRDNTGRGAQAMSAAADDLKKAAETFREELTAAATDGAAAFRGRLEATSGEAGDAIAGAGQALLTAFEATGRQIAALGTEMGASIGEDLLTRLDSVGMQLEDLSVAIERGASEARRAADGMSDGAKSITGASSSFGAASNSLVAAAEPLRASHERIEGSLRRIDGHVQTVSDAMVQNARQIADSSRNVLATAETALGNEREGIRQSMEATRAALRDLSDQARKLEEIDQLLGRALQDYNSQLESALGTAQDHVIEMREKLAPGLDTLREVVQQAEAFLPAQRRTA
ncbi:hypothetical protein [Oceaniglobus roseus]|uniref:hypothetical protein n=1 Tax=Oceaniglobus roseus TaxID=1737570 RepID=UPI000C7ECD20|nr:hypothetical protein [Kandeliimicrobium roseum]